MRGWALVNLVLGAWLVVAPWILGYGGRGAAVNDVVLGVAVGAAAIILLVTGLRGWAWVTLVLGAWLVAAPWILGYGGIAAAATNDVILGLAIGVVSVIQLTTAREVPRAVAEAPRMAGMEAMTPGAMRDMAAALARMPDAQRKVMMGERLRMFARMPEAERKRAMAAMMEGVAALPDDEKKKLFKTRFEVLAELSESERKSLMGTHMAILMEKGMEMMHKEMELTEAVLPQLPPPVRQMVQMMMESMRTGGMH
jgi:hypothetical protein